MFMFYGLKQCLCSTVKPMCMLYGLSKCLCSTVLPFDYYTDLTNVYVLRIKPLLCSADLTIISLKKPEGIQTGLNGIWLASAFFFRRYNKLFCCLLYKVCSVHL